MKIQLALMVDDHIEKSIIEVPIDQLKISELNPRTYRQDEDIQRLAERINRNGYELTRALWARKNGKGYEVFAGGNRLEAARLAQCETIPIILHKGATDQDVIRLAYQDNDNDEYHTPVSIVDVWANYAALKSKGWKQQQIAEAVGVSRVMVSYRQNLHLLPDKIKEYVSQEKLTEAHLTEIMEMSVDLHFSPWLTTEQAMIELCQLASKGLTVRKTATLVTKWQGFIDLAKDKGEYLKTQQEKYEFDNGIKFSQKYHAAFIGQLAKDQARTKVAVMQSYNVQRDKYLERIKQHELELAQQQDKAEAERNRLEQEKAKTAAIEKIISNIYLGDFYEVCKRFADNSIDVILTDPPYPKEYIEEYGKLAEVAARILKPGGFLLAMCGQSYLPAILNLMTPHLDYHWTISYRTPGGQSPQIWTRNINTFWKPVLWFAKGEIDKEKWYGDVVSSDVNDNDKAYHKWGQSESGIKQLIEKYTKPDDLILDPFFGGGTIGIVALDLGRQFIGIDKEDITISKDRVYNFLTGDSYE